MKLEPRAGVFIASDHAGYEWKEGIKQKFPDFAWEDLGPASADRVDYPDFADRLALALEHGSGKFGILICGSGQGMAIRANRYPHVRAALCWSAQVAELSRQHNNANVLCLGARLLSMTECEKVVQAFVSTEFEGGRHQQRVDKLSQPPHLSP